MNLKVVLEPSEDGGFTVTVPALPGCISEGDTREEARRNIREAIELYLAPVEDDVLETDGMAAGTQVNARIERRIGLIKPPRPSDDGPGCASCPR